MNITSHTIIKKLYQIMNDIHTIFTNNGLKYWATRGTFLGSIRNKGIIPWDDDLDIGILTKDVHKFLKLEPLLNKCNYTVVKVPNGYKIFKQHSRSGKKIVPERGPWMDIYTYSEKNDMFMSNKKSRENRPGDEYSTNELFPLQEYKFGILNIFGPAKHDEYFTRMYGNDWNTHGYIFSPTNEENKKIKLTNVMKKPARPFNEIKQRPCLKGCLLPCKKSDPEIWMKKPAETCTTNGDCYNNFAEKMGIYVINCKMHVQRYNKFLKYAEAAGIRACRVPCVLGKKFTKNMICDLMNSDLLSPDADMTQIEVSINMSHYNSLMRVVNSCLDYGMIMEDDVELKIDFVEKVNEILDTLRDNDIDFSILHLFNGNWARTMSYYKKIVDVDDDIKIYQETEYYNAGGVCYIVSKEFAQFLIDNYFPITIPQDMMFGNYVHHGKHLTVKMKFNKEKGYYESPVLDMDLSGPFGTGAATTQQHQSPSVKTYSCEPCN